MIQDNNLILTGKVKNYIIYTVIIKEVGFYFPPTQKKKDLKLLFLFSLNLITYLDY